MTAERPPSPARSARRGGRAGPPRWLVTVGAVVLVVVLGVLGVDLGQPGGDPPVDRAGQPTAGQGEVGGAPRDQQPVGTDVDPETGLAWVSLGSLPPEAAQVLERIEAGGPFRYERDGAVFHNFEGLLPERPRGWYREYTVPTPGEDDRGARRIVTGDEDTTFFWTADHYASFERIRR